MHRAIHSANTACEIAEGRRLLATTTNIMNPPSFLDRRALRLLARVGDDLAHLRHDIANLASHATHKTLPHTAKEFAENARNQLSASSSLAVSRLRALKVTPPSRETVGITAGLLAIGLIAAGTYVILRNGGCSTRCSNAEDEDISL